MMQRVVDAMVLTVFSVLYSCAVFLLQFRSKSRPPVASSKPVMERR